MISKTAPVTITDQQKKQYQDEGYFILERAIDPDMLQMLREECSYFLGYKDCQLDQRQQQVDGITHKRKRYFISNWYRKSQRMDHFIFSDLMAQVCRAALGDNVYLFHEQWVVKGAEQGMKFAWHQDSGYLKHGHPQSQAIPYLTCWVPLDDVNEENGTVYLLPHSSAGTRDRIFDHTRETGSNDLVGYTGDEPGIPVVVPAGSIVCFSSFTFHRSGANHTNHMRRVYLPQYASQPFLNEQGQTINLAVPFVKDGKNIYDSKADLSAQG